jgi:hypothetical protein
VQKALIERAARLTLYIELMDAEALVVGTMSERNSRQYLAWVNALRLCLREIGLDEAKPEMRQSRSHRLPPQEGGLVVKPLVSMRAALGDDDLLGKALPGPSWSSWRTLLIAAMGEPLLDGERAVFAELTGGREREPGEPAEEVHAITGRRSGKTRAAATTATYLATLCDHSDQLAPGERAGAAAVERDDLAGDAAFNLIRGIFAARLRWLR